jgi:hypothetical protein
VKRQQHQKEGNDMAESIVNDQPEQNETTPITLDQIMSNSITASLQAISVFNNNTGPLPITSQQFKTGGGTLLIFASGSAFRGDVGLIGMDIKIDK